MTTVVTMFPLSEDEGADVLTPVKMLVSVSLLGSVLSMWLFCEDAAVC